MENAIQLPEDLLAKAREAADRRRIPLDRLIYEAVSSFLRRPSFDLPRAGEGGLLPGVNLSSSADLADRMDDL